MVESNYKLAGWLAVAQAVLFPLMFVVGIAEAGVASRLFDFKRPFIGPSDLMGTLSTAIGVYVQWMLRRFLNERYNYHELDLLIIISIWWLIFFHIVGLGLSLVTMIYWPIDRTLLLVVYLVFFASAMVTVGIVDIMIAVKLLKDKEAFGEFIRGFAYVSLVAGILEVSVFLSPLSIILVPVLSILLALIFLRDKQEVEFV